MSNQVVRHNFQLLKAGKGSTCLVSEQRHYSFTEDNVISVNFNLILHTDLSSFTNNTLGQEKGNNEVATIKM